MRTDSHLDSELGETTNAYSIKVGERLRAIRRQKALSLQEAEERSGQEFKASVLGAYERGERAISVARLQRLAAVYQVPVDQLLPAEVNGNQAVDGFIDLTVAPPKPVDKVAVNLQALRNLDGTGPKMLDRFLSTIQVQRQDFNGRMLSIRNEDLRAVACMLDTSIDGVGRRLEELGIRHVQH